MTEINIVPESAIHPHIKRAVAYFKFRTPYRVTSLLRPDSLSHAAGRALDVAPLSFDNGHATLARSKEMAEHLRSLGLPLIVVGEGNHFHIEVSPDLDSYYGYVRGRDVTFPTSLATGSVMTRQQVHQNELVHRSFLNSYVGRRHHAIR